MPIASPHKLDADDTLLRVSNGLGDDIYKEPRVELEDPEVQRRKAGIDSPLNLIFPQTSIRTKMHFAGFCLIMAVAVHGLPKAGSL